MEDHGRGRGRRGGEEMEERGRRDKQNGEEKKGTNGREEGRGGGRREIEKEEERKGE